MRSEERKLKKIREIIKNFSEEDILTNPDFTIEQNYKWIAYQYAQPIEEIWNVLQEDNQ